MAQSDSLTRIRSLKLETQASERPSSELANILHSRPKRPSYHGSFPSEDTIRARATPPIEIPGHHEEPASAGHGPAVEASTACAGSYLQDHETSLQIVNAEEQSPQHRRVTAFGLGQQLAHHDARGRSLAQALREQRALRTHSESDRSHYDPVTGRHLPAYSESPPKEEARVGEARFPLLQKTVDEMARRGLNQPMSLTSETTMSPTEEAVITPSDTDARFLSSPITIAKHFSTSYESPRPRSQRKASERWRDGETAPDFFSRAGSLKKAGSSRRSSRRDTGSTRSPNSVASSFLRGFSTHHAIEDNGPPPIDAEGATVGEDYVLGKQIGYGGFSIIREVKQMVPQTGEQRTLAVKIVRKQIDGKSKVENDVAQSDFEHEVDLWRLLSHKHILSLEAVYELDEATFCFVPLNTGGTLFDLVSNNRQGLPLDLAASYAYQMASALRYLHLDARVVHRDIKLENVLVDTTNGSPGLVRLCDFGLAEWIASDSDSTTSSSPSSISLHKHEHTLHRYFGPADSSTSAFAGGSLEYAAPEILRIATASGRVGPDDVPPEKTIVSPAVDIWAMGVCIFALLMGRRPFQDSFQPRIVMAILAGDWPKQALVDKAGQQAYRLVKRCLTMSASQRADIGEIYGSSWFDEVRSNAEGSDAESESAHATGWRL